MRDPRRHGPPTGQRPRVYCCVNSVSTRITGSSVCVSPAASARAASSSSLGTFHSCCKHGFHTTVRHAGKHARFESHGARIPAVNDWLSEKAPIANQAAAIEPVSRSTLKKTDKASIPYAIRAGKEVMSRARALGNFNRSK